MPKRSRGQTKTYRFTVFLFATFCRRVYASTITPAPVLTAREPAITPTGKGEIGVNPVDDLGLGDERHYVAPIGEDSSPYTVDGETTKWIGVNSEYLTETVVITTINNVQTATSTTVHVQATTATSGTDGLAAGDVVVKMSEPFRKQLEEAVTAVAKTCGITRKWKRQVENEVLTCLLNEASKKAQDPSFLDFAASELEDIGLDLGADPTALLGAAGEVLKSQLLKKKYYLLVAGLVTTGAVGAALEVDRVIRPSFGIPGKFKFPDGQLSKPKEDDEKPSPTSSSSACDPKKTPDENSPACDEDDCDGEDWKCRNGIYKGCACVPWTSEVHVKELDNNTIKYKDFFDDQQKILEEALADLPDSVPPKCFRNTNGDNFEGKPKASPSAWCLCTSGTETGKYSTIPSTTAPCAYETMPSKTIMISRLYTNTHEVTSCRLVEPTQTAADISALEPYCTCNDDKMHGSPIQHTSVENGSTKTRCIAPTPKPRPLCGNFGSENGGDEFHAVPFHRDTGLDVLAKYCGLHVPMDGKEPWSPPYALAAPGDESYDEKREQQKASYPSEMFVMQQEPLQYCMSRVFRGRGSGHGVWQRPESCQPSVDLHVVFQWSKNQTGCAPQKTWYLPKGKEACFDKLVPLIDDCNTNTRKEKMGGVWRVKTDSGCVDFFLYGYSHMLPHDKYFFPDGQPNESHQIEM